MEKKWFYRICKRIFVFLLVIALTVTQLGPAEGLGQNLFQTSRVIERSQEMVYPDKETVISLGQVKLDIPAGAVKEPIMITIEKLKSINELNPGMDNATGGAIGYRFLPHGTKFLKNIKVTIPYDQKRISSEEDFNNLYTYFYNEESNFWECLERFAVDKKNVLVTSLTNHFTDMINGVLSLPESPSNLNFNPNSIKDIKAANPAAGINLIGISGANHQGSAVLNYPIEVPPGRSGMQAQVAVQYNSEGGSSWMGEGWDIPTQCISIDTRWGVPRYDHEMETESYTLNGTQLAPVANRGVLEKRTEEKVFYPRVEGSFSKIIRHGNSPQNYWWEVTAKDGMRYFYGKTPEGAMNGETILSDGKDNNIFSWMLVQIRDTHGNTVDYTYKRVGDSGVNDPNASKGVQVYLKKIRYTGAVGQPGPYVVEFIRDREEPGFDPLKNRRPDVSINARAGFKMVTADLLKRIEVKLYGDNQEQKIRSYGFEYGQGVFGKTLLKAIVQYGQDGSEFNRHTLEYSKGNVVEDLTSFSGFSREQDINVSISDYIGNSIAGMESSLLGGTTGESTSYSVSAGISVLGIFSIGVKGSKNGSTNEDILTLVDINGDGLLDIVYKYNGTCFYKANLSKAYGELKFGDAKVIADLKDIRKEASGGSSFGISAGFSFIEGETEDSSSYTTSSTYLCDVNADVLPDLVSDGNVWYNHVEDGQPKFVLNDNSKTPVQIDNSSEVDLYKTLNAGGEKAEAKVFPVDSVRCFEAPFDGNVEIKAPVRLMKISESGYKNADGVRVSVQKNNVVLWSTLIGPDNHQEIAPSGLSSVNVAKGEKIFFRVQSLKNGAYDVVEWDPEINYTGADRTQRDENGFDPYHFKASEDFVYAGRYGEILVPLEGRIHVKMALDKKGITSDDVKILITKNDVPVFTKEIKWNEVNLFPIDTLIDVKKEDKLRIKIDLDSAVDLKKLDICNPNIYYTKVIGEDAKVYDNNGNPLITMDYIMHDVDIYADRTGSSFDGYYEAKEDGVLNVTPNIAIGFPETIKGEEKGSIDGDIFFTVKKPNELVRKEKILIEDGIVKSKPEIQVNVKKGDKLYFGFSTKSGKLAKNIKAYCSSYSFTAHAAVSGSLSSPAVISGSLRFIADQNILPYAYRGWSYFGYNAAGTRSENPINQSELYADANTKEEDLKINGDPKVFTMIPYKESGRWICDDEFCWIEGTRMSSSVKGLKIFGAGGTNAIKRGVPKVSYSDQSSDSLGISVGGVGAAYSVANGSSDSLVDYMDLNGDGFPDVVSKGQSGSSVSVQYSTMNGGLEANTREVEVWQGNSIRTGKNHAENFAVNGATAVMKSDAEGYGPGSRQSSLSAKKDVTVGISGNASIVEKSAQAYDLIDINGDGLPDRVYLPNPQYNQDGRLMVALNLGYGFAAPEYWDDAQVSYGESKSSGAGVNGEIEIPLGKVGIGFGGGVSWGSFSSNIKNTFADINGDGLVDYLFTQNDKIKVRINTGTGFSVPCDWNGFLPGKNIKDVKGKSKTEEVHFKIKIGFGIFSVSVKVSRSTTWSINRDEAALIDIDGNGYLDHVYSNGLSGMRVALNDIKHVNKLEKVNGPLGSSITLKYKQDGHTYDLPQSKWVLSEVTVFDGHPGDGADQQVTAYDYEGGKYDRLEREFYGYRKVITQDRDSLNNNTVYRKVIDTYLNNSYYTRGLLECRETTDGQDKKYTKIQNSYKLWDVLDRKTYIETNTNSTMESPAVVFPKLERTDKFFYEGQPEAGLHTYVTYGYDEHGNVTGYFEERVIGDSTDDILVKTEYFKDLESYIVDKPCNVRVYGGSNLMRHTEADYAPRTGDLTEFRQYAEEGKPSVTNREYYPSGNLRKTTGPANASGERYSLSYQYDQTVNTYVTQINDSFGYTTCTYYNYLYGVPVQTIDINRNLMTHKYDNFGRLVEVYSPYDTVFPAVKFDYYPNERPAKAVTQNKVLFDAANRETLDTVIFVDGLNRVIQTKKEGEVQQEGQNSSTYGMNVTGAIEFDALGRVIKEGQPTFQSGYNTGFIGVQMKNPTVYGYDAMDRKTSSTLPDGSQARTAFSIENGLFKTVDTDPKDNQTHSYQNINGKTVKTLQFNQGKTITNTFVYNPLDEAVKVIDDKGNTTKTAYDMLGRSTSISNPDRGLVECFYDPAGNLVKKIDNSLRKKNQSINYIYEYNRLKKVDYPVTKDVEYTYGGPTAPYNRVGRIASVSDASGETRYYYGKLGENIKNERFVSFLTAGIGTWRFVSEYGYDYLGRLQWMKYPDSEKLYYVYDKGGQVTQVYGIKFGDRYDYVDAIRYDEFGQRVYIDYSNGTDTKYTYDPYRRWLHSIESGNSFGVKFQDTTYSFDKVGNVLGYENKGQKVVQNYSYDDLYQLTGASGSGVFKYCNRPTTYSQSYTYDSIGNMLTKKSESTTNLQKSLTLNYEFTYNYNGKGPHAPNKIGNFGFEYDENGNTTNRYQLLFPDNATNRVMGDEFTWNEDNRMTKAKVNNVFTDFVYDASGTRVIKNSMYGEAAYVSEYYSIQVYRNAIKNIFVGNTRMASKVFHYTGANPDSYASQGIDLYKQLYEPSHEKRSTYVYHSDHLGSSNVISDYKGNVYQHIEYTPYGELWMDESDADANLLPYKFTGKEMDEETGMYSFPARYYEPTFSRWMSVDPAMDGVNWYGYCNNNPVNYVDPTGLEAIVISGGAYSSSTTGYRHEFIETGIKKIRELRAAHSKQNITWIVAMAGWTQDDFNNFQSAVEDLNVSVLGIGKKEQLISYINYKNGSDRQSDRITDFTVFAHGQQGQIDLGLRHPNEGALSFTMGDIESIEQNAFDNPVSRFYSCNTGTGGTSSFAAKWVDRVGGRASAFVGKSDYEKINIMTGISDMIERGLGKASRSINVFSLRGSLNYPVAGQTLVDGRTPYMTTFFKEYLQPAN
ncbi:MAG: hypothetical protein N2645_13180 [Clostridia bacterium]|nr:hypothetical protein [Clostridia bacterium]